MSTPWLPSEPLPPLAARDIRRRMIFAHCKWDPQVHDGPALCDTPLVLTPQAWATLSADAEALYHETLAAERALLARPDLCRELGLPGRVRRLLRRGAPTPGVARFMRFDFHFTADGWRLSEVNGDVPGGFIEASAFSRLVGGATGLRSAGDPAAALTAALRAAPGVGRVALTYATAYTDDAQVMHFLGRSLTDAGLEVVHAPPDALPWSEVDAVLRFYPAEWLPMLGRRSGWSRFFVDGGVRVSNPGSALLTQSKRWPLVWDRLDTALPTWRRLLPETCAPRRTLRCDPGWVWKPALGRVGEGIVMDGCTTPADRRAAWRSLRRWPGHWVMQRRFDTVAWPTSAGPRFVCLGVFVVEGEACGVYGRAAASPLIDGRAQDVAVMLADAPAPRRETPATAPHTATFTGVTAT